jgi:Ca2+-binding RTX toxin-like protein
MNPKMHSFLKTLFFLLIIITGLSSCKSPTQAQNNDIIYAKDPELRITAVPEVMGSRYVNAFDRYTEIIAPNGGAIRIVAQNRITNEQIVRARNILQHYLTDVPGTLYGADKSQVANKMAENSAVLALLNFRDDGSNKTRVPAQSLFEEELPVEGHPWYMDNQYNEHRDAAFEEILHMVHDYGIGVDGKGGQAGAVPAYQALIRKAQESALTNNRWAIGMNPDEGWLKELKAENSLTQEYLASVIDSWYGLWGAWNDSSVPESSERGMWGFYIAKTREEVQSEDPDGAAIAEMFFADYLNYNARIDSSLSGTFSLQFDKSLLYTHKSRYLKDITLTGELDSSVRVNSFDNDLTGNSGVNTALFSGKESEYTITKENGDSVVKDTIANRDGVNTLRSFEALKFSDRTVLLE